MQFPASLLAVVLAAAQPAMSAPLEAKVEKGTNAAEHSFFLSPTYTASPNISTTSTSTSSSPTTPITAAGRYTPALVVRTDGVLHHKPLREYLDFSTKPEDKLYDCCKKCLVESSGKKFWGMTVNVDDSTGMFCNYEIPTSTWLREIVIPCVESACAPDLEKAAASSKKWLGNVCPGKYGN